MVDRGTSGFCHGEDNRFSTTLVYSLVVSRLSVRCLDRRSFQSLHTYITSHDFRMIIAAAGYDFRGTGYAGISNLGIEGIYDVKRTRQMKQTPNKYSSIAQRREILSTT